MESSLDLTTLFSYQNGRTQIATMHWPSTCVKINASPRKSISVNVLIFISRFDLSECGISFTKFHFHFDFLSVVPWRWTAKACLLLQPHWLMEVSVQLREIKF